MTRQEYDTKATNGTLSVGDIIRNPEFATPEQVEQVVNGDLLRELRKRGKTDVEVLQYFARLLDGDINHVTEDLGVMEWENLNRK